MPHPKETLRTLFEIEIAMGQGLLVPWDLPALKCSEPAAPAAEPVEPIVPVQEIAAPQEAPSSMAVSVPTPDVILSEPLSQAAPMPRKENVPMPLDQKQKALTALEADVIACRKCSLGSTRLNPVFGRGNPDAELLLIGEAPGAEEDRQGLAFVGRSGKLLDNMLSWIGFDSFKDVFICNVLKCRPPENRNPDGQEVVQCRPYLLEQIRLVAPKVIVMMGRFAVQATLETAEALGRLRGQIHYFHGVPSIVTYHPAYLLRNPPEKKNAAEDWALAKSMLAYVKSGQPLRAPGPKAIVIGRRPEG